MSSRGLRHRRRLILIMSVTGVLLTYERQISWWADTRHYSTQPPQPDAPRRSISSLIVGVHEAEPRGTFTTMTVRAIRSRPSRLPRQIARSTSIGTPAT